MSKAIKKNNLKSYKNSQKTIKTFKQTLYKHRQTIQTNKSCKTCKTWNTCSTTKPCKMYVLHVSPNLHCRLHCLDMRCIMLLNCICCVMSCDCALCSHFYNYEDAAYVVQFCIIVYVVCITCIIYTKNRKLIHNVTNIQNYTEYRTL